MKDITEKIFAGDIHSAASLITMIENSREDSVNYIKDIFPHTGNAYVIGITGSPGAGKSTLVSEVISCYRQQGKTVGVIAVDSSSPFTGGAVLGDRIRMQKHEADDQGVFVRSMATRGNLGGLSRATRDAVYVMDAMGRDIIIIETVGVGQVELDVAKMAYTTVVVLTPGMGDDIQAIKAGIMEIGDIFLINKADLDGSGRAEKDVFYMLHIRGARHDGWEPEIFKTVALTGKGVPEFVQGIEKHRKFLVETGLINKKKYTKGQLINLVKERLETLVLHDIDESVDECVQKIVHKEIDPYTASDIIISKIKS